MRVFWSLDFQIWDAEPIGSYNENIPKSKKNWKSETLLVPSVADKGYSTCIYKKA